MFWIFKIFPEWLWPALVLLGIIAFAIGYLPQAKNLAKPIKIIALVVIALGIFINGMKYADSTWKQAAAELEAKVAQAEAKSQAVNETITERVVNKTHVVKVRGEQIVKYVDREVVKYDHSCVIPPEFVTAHNRAAEQLK